MKKNFLMLLLMMLVIVVSGCANSGSEEEITISSIKIKVLNNEVSDINLYEGEKVSISGEIKYSDGSIVVDGFRWKIEDESIVNFIDGEIRALKAGETKVTLSKDGESISVDVKVKEVEVEVEKVMFSAGGNDLQPNAAREIFSTYKDVKVVVETTGNGKVQILVDGKEFSNGEEVSLLENKDVVVEILVDGEVYETYKVIYIKNLIIVGSVIGKGRNDWDPLSIEVQEKGGMELKNGLYVTKFYLHDQIVDWIDSEQEPIVESIPENTTYAFKIAAADSLGGSGMEFNAGELHKGKEIIKELKEGAILERTREQDSWGDKNIYVNLEKGAEYEFSFELETGKLTMKKTNDAKDQSLKLELEEATIEAGEDYILPQTANLTTGEKTSKVSVTWKDKAGNEIEGSKVTLLEVGDYEFTGMTTSHPYSVLFKLKVITVK